MLTPEYLRTRLRYDADAGKLFWLVNPYARSQWNGRFAGGEAFTADDGHGYRQGNIGGTVLKAHRVVRALVHGVWPAGDIDHLNGNRADNRLGNLRAVTHAENGRNQLRYRNNTSGTTGVYWREDRGCWSARIKVKGKSLHLGHFKNRPEAEAARKKADAELGYHANHGKTL